jgi:hypothetical protein
VNQKLFEVNWFQLNKLYQKFQTNLYDNIDYFHDYNALVDSIIQISPPNKGQKPESQKN